MPYKAKKFILLLLSTIITHKVLTKRGYILNKKRLTDTQLKKIKTDLTFKPFVNKEYNDDAESFPVFTEEKNNICVPKYYGIKNFGKQTKTIGMSQKKRKFKFNGGLREKQKPIMDTSIAHLKEKGGGLLQLHCGCGKTVLALYLACHFKLKTLIVVHKTFLQNQWLERIKEFTMKYVHEKETKY